MYINMYIYIYIQVSPLSLGWRKPQRLSRLASEPAYVVI